MAISASEAREKLFPLIEQVNADHVPVEIVSRNHGTVYLVSGDDLSGWQETARILSNPRNAALLIQRIAAVENGRYETHDLIEESE